MTAEYLKTLLTPLLSKPDALVIEESSDSLGVLLRVHVSIEDMGTCIGKSGATAQAIRHLVRIVGFRENARIAVKFDEPPGSRFIQPTK